MVHNTQLEKLFHRGYLWQAAGVNSEQPNATSTGAAHASEVAPFGITDIDSVLPAGGLHYGALHEFFIDTLDSKDPLHVHVKPHALILQLLRNNLQRYLSSLSQTDSFSSRYQAHSFNKYIAWIGKDFFPYPGAVDHYLSFKLPHQSLSFSKRCVFLRPNNKEELLCCLEAALQSSSLVIIVAFCQDLSFNASKKLALLAQKHHCLLLLYRPLLEQHTKSFAASRWKITPYASTQNQLAWTLELLQLKGRKPAHSSWVVAQQVDTKFSLLEHQEVNNGKVSLHLLSQVVPTLHAQAAQTAVR